MVTREERESKENPSPYQKMLEESFQMNQPRILSFKDNPPTPIEPIPRRLLWPPSHKPKSLRHIPQGPERILDAPGIVDDLSLNLLDWGSKNILAVAIGNTVYLWNASNSSIAELVTIDEEDGPVTSVSWACDGRHIAVGLNNSFIQLWDSISLKQVRTFGGGHQGRVGSLAWNKNILTTGGMDGQVTNNDPRVRYHIVGTFKGHQQEISGLKWSDSGQHLASGGNDNLLFIWDRSTMCLNSPRKWLHRHEDHIAAIKALAWCPFQENLLASGGGEGDQCIKFWNTRTGSCLNSVETGSEVCGLLWNKKERELFSSHGFSDNHLVLWKYPSMERMAELKGHASKVLFMTQSPDGCTMATAAADERLKFGTCLAFLKLLNLQEK